MSLLQMSLSASIMILAIMGIRVLALHRLSKKLFPIFWGMVLVRLLVPFSLPAPFSIYQLTSRSTAEVHGVMAVTTALPSGPEAAAPAITPTAGLSLGTLLWAVGLILGVLYFTIAYIRCLRMFGTALPVENKWACQWLAAHSNWRPISLRQTDRIAAPLTYGLFKPVILLPAQTDWTDTDGLQYVLAHEYGHIRRLDGAFKLLLTAALCLHWFNPLVWLMYALANRDIELACDEKVVRLFGETTRSAYALTLISMEEKKNEFVPLCSNFSKNTTKERIEAIMKIKKTSLAAAMIALGLMSGVTAVFATSAPANEESTLAAYTTDVVKSPSQPAPHEMTQEEVTKLYGAFGITFDAQEKMLYNGEPVRYFCDGVAVGDGGWSIHYEYLNENGTVDIMTKRSQIDNHDGSIDPFGELLGLEKASQEDFAKRQLTAPAQSAVTDVMGSDTAGGETIADRLAKYAAYGIVYEERPNSSGAGNVFYKGQPVKQFIDETPGGGVFSYGSRDGGKLTVRTVYGEDGALRGVEEVHDAGVWQ